MAMLIVLSSLSMVSANEQLTNQSGEVISAESEDVFTDNDKTYEDIQVLVDNAKEGDTVKIAGTYKSSGKAIRIDKTITLEGESNNTVLTGRDGSPQLILDIAAQNVTVKNIIFQNDRQGISTGYYCYGVVKNCVFKNFKDSAFHGNGQFYDCIFDNNLAVEGAAINFVGDYVTEFIVSNCRFTNNRAKWGGAIYVLGDALIKNCYFENNTAEVYANDVSYGQIYNCEFANYSSSSLRDCLIYNISLTQSGSHYQSKTITVNLTCTIVNKPSGGVTLNYIKPISDDYVTLKFSNGKTAKIKTNSEGIATYDVDLYSGTYSVTATYNAMDKSLGNIKILNAPAKLTAGKLTTTYASGKYFTVSVVNSNTGKPISGAKVLLKVYTGKKYKKVYITTDSKGIAKYNTGNLAIGKHKIVVGNSFAIQAKSINSQVKINKAKRLIVAPNVIVAHKKSGKFVVTVKHKESKKPLKGVKLTINVYTGKKYKKYTVKTNKNGQAAISTKKLSKTTHKVVVKIPSNSKYYAAGKISKIIVKKKVPSTSKKEDEEFLSERKETYIREGLITSFIYVSGNYAGFEGDYTVYSSGAKKLDDAVISIYVDGKFSHNITSGSHTKIYANRDSVVELVYQGNIYYKGFTLRIVK